METPKEEPVLKCDLCERYPRLEGTNKCESCYSVVRHFLEQNPKFKDKLLPDLRKRQETLEEAAERYIAEDNNNRYYNDFIAGGKWQQERMYSEEEVKNLVKIIEWYDEVSDVRPDYKPSIEERIGDLTMWEWFEQFKKK